MARTMFALMLAAVFVTAGFATFLVASPANDTQPIDDSYASGGDQDNALVPLDFPIPEEPPQQEVPETPEPPRDQEPPEAPEEPEAPEAPEAPETPEAPTPEDVPDPREIHILDDGEGPDLHEDWVFDVAGDADNLVAEIVVEIDRTVTTVYDCAQLILEDAAGVQVDGWNTGSIVLGNDEQWVVELDMDAEELQNFTPGEWALSLHVNGVQAVYDVELHVTY